MTLSIRIQTLARDPARARLIRGVSIAAMVGALGAGPAQAQTIAALHAAMGQGGVPAAATAALANYNSPAANPYSAAMAAATARAQRNQAQLTQAVSLAQQAQAAARAAVAALHIPDGLAPGGLQVVANPVPAANDPTGLHTWDGAKAPTQSGGVVTIDQTAPRAVLSWTSFNVGAKTTVDFVQQANGVSQPSWVVLNRVVGQLNPNGLRGGVGTPTQILGSIKADGTVLILDQNGVMFGPTAQVNTNSLIATSLEIGHALEAVNGSTMPITISQRDNEFLGLGLLGYVEQNTTASDTSTFSAQATSGGGLPTYDPLLEGAVQVQTGATINSASSGYVLLIAPRVVNGGALTSPNGQVSLVSGRIATLTASKGDANSIDQNLRGLFITSSDVGGVTGDYVDNASNGLISAPGGYISLQATGVTGGAVLDSGVLTATTSVSLNGYVNIQGSTIQLDPNAVIAITPDTGPASIPQSPTSIAGFKRSVIRIGDTGSQIDIGANSLIFASSATIDIGADPGQATASVAVQTQPSRVFIDAGATIDASGLTDVQVAASVNSIQIKPATQNDLQNTPTYRSSFLDGATVYVDPRLSGVLPDGVAWVGSPLINAASYYQQIGVTASELMTTGGNVTIGASAQTTGVAITQTPDVIVKAGASISVSGGWRTFQAGVVRTTQLIDASGQLVDIGAANPNASYLGIYNGFSVNQARWGVTQTYNNPLQSGQHMEGAYTEGRDAGSLTIKASSVVLDGQVNADAFAGPEQTVAAQAGTATGSIYGDVRKLQGAPSQLPSGGYLNIQALGLDGNGNYTGGGDIAIVGSAEYAPLSGDFAYGQPISFAADGSLIVPARPPSATLPANRLDVISLNADALSAMGLSQLTVQTSGQVNVGQDAVVNLAAGGAFEATAGRTINIDGRVNAPGGSIDLATGNFDSPTALLGGSVFVPTLVRPGSANQLGSYDLVVNGQLNVAGRWANDFGVASGQLAGSAYQNGGEITLYAAPRIAPLDQTVNFITDPGAPTQSVDVSGSILLNAVGALNVTGGGYVTPTGAINTAAKGGAVSLFDDTTYFQLADDPQRNRGGISGFRVSDILFNGSLSNLVAINPNAITSRVVVAPGSILAHGFGGGGTFTLSTPAFNFGDGPATVGTYLPLDFFSATGFSSYNIKSYATNFVPNTFTPPAGALPPGQTTLGGYNTILQTQIVTVGAGQTLSLSESLFSPLLDASQIATLRNFATGGDLNTVLTPVVPTDAWDARPVNLSLGGLIELKVDQGGAIIGQAGGVLNVGQLYNKGTIRMPGGAITQSELLPSLYAGANVLAVTSLDEAFSYETNGALLESGPDTEANLIDTSTGQLLTNGQVAARAFIYLLGDLNAGEGVRLAPGSVTDLSGEAIVNPRAVQQGGVPIGNFAQGTVINGGALQALGAFTGAGSLFHATVGNSVYAAGNEPTSGIAVADQLIANPASNGQPAALINLAGASATFDLPTAPAAFTGGALSPTYAPTLIWSNGGALSLGSGGTLTGATIQAQGGAPAAQGGTLTDLRPVLYQTDPVQPTFNAISANMLQSAGFDTFVAQGALSSVRDVTLDLRGALFVTAAPQDGGLKFTSGQRDAYSPTISSGGALTVNAAYIGLDGAFQALSTPTAIAGVTANNSVTLNAAAIDITGAVLFDQSVANVTLSAKNDLRLIGVAPYQEAFNTGQTFTPSLAGQLAVNGDLTIVAAQVYPTTGTSFTLSSIAPTGTIAFKSSGATPVAPYSAGGALTVQAANIDQGGVIRVPLGSLTLGGGNPLTLNDDGVASAPFAPATQSLTLAPGSITSVSTDGLVIPYGTTTDQIEWFFTPTTSNPLTAPPAAVLQLGGANVDVMSGATVDIKGAGDIYAYEFIAGIGGSRDVLSQFNPDVFSANNGYQYPDHRQIYAIVPSLANVTVAPYDPIYSSNYASLYGPGQVGTRVYLDAAPGLAAGWYTLLPAQYALLSGGLRVVQDSAATPPTTGSVTLEDGTEVVSGYYGGVGGAYQSTQSVFDVQSQSVFRSFSNIALTYGNQTFAADAAKAGVTTPRLPIDAGRLILTPVTSLSIAGTFDTAPATGGRGSQVDISGTALDIVDSVPAGGGPGGAIVLTSGSLANLNAASLLLGGLRTDNADGTTSLSVTSSSISVEAGATVSAPEVLMATDGSGASLTVASGATIMASGTVSNPATGDYLIAGVASGTPGPTGQGGFLRVANGPQRLVLRGNVQATIVPGAVTIDGATLNGTSVEVESSGDLNVLPTSVLTATNLSLADSTILFAPSATGQAGLVITPQLQALLSQTKQLTLQSPNAIAFDSGAYGFGNLTLDTPGLANAAGGSVTLNGGVLQLANSSAAPLACGAAGAPACGAGSLAINASQLVFQSGSIQTYGFDTGVSLTASQGILADGVASFNVGPAALAMTTPFVGDRGVPLAMPSQTASQTLPSLTLASTGAVDITAPTGGGAFTAPTGTPGSSLTVDGQTISISGAELRATAGSLSINAANGVTLAGGAVLATPGYQKVFSVPASPVMVSAPGGRLSLVTTGGDINVSSDSRLDVAGGQGGQAGSLVLSAHNGQVVAPVSTFDAGGAGAGASLSLDTGGSFDLASFVQGPGTAFTGNLTIHTGQGVLDLNAGETLRAVNVELSANGGTINSAGTIDVSGTVGGNVSLYGAGGVTLASGSLINAEANGYGVADTRQATGGNVTLGVDGNSAITVDSGATINVGLSASDPNSVNRVVQMARTSGAYYSYVAADQGGTVTFRAPVLQKNGAETVAVNVQGAVTGAGGVILEGYQSYDLATIAARTKDYTGVTIVNGQAVLNLGTPGGATTVNFLAGNALPGGPGTLVSFIQNFNLSTAGTGLTGMANLHVRPGVDLTYSGDIVLASNWNLGAGAVDIQGAVAAGLMAPDPNVAGQYYVVPGDEARVFANYTKLTYRVGGLVTGEHGVLALQAGGNLDLKYSITDGFFQFANQTDPHYLDYALGGGNRIYQPTLNPACFNAGDCSGVNAWMSGAQPANYVNVGFAGGPTGLSPDFYNPAPYSATANSPDAPGSLAGGTGDPLGSAQLFPLLPTADGAGKVVNSWSYQLVAGAALNGSGFQPNVDPLATAAGTDRSVIVEGLHVYHYASTPGNVRFANSLDVANPAGSPVPLTPDQWLTSYLAANPTLGPNSFTILAIAKAPFSARLTLAALARQFFASYPNQFDASTPGQITTTLALAAQFMSYLSKNFSQLAPDYPLPLEHTSTQPIYATAPTLVRTGTGDIAMAASGDINLQNGATPVVPRSNLHGPPQPATPGGAQLGGAAVYTAGHLAQLGTTNAIDVATNQILSVNLAATAINTNVFNQQFNYQYGAKSKGYAGIMIANPVYAVGGGNIDLIAGRDVLGRRDTSLEKLLGGVSNPYMGSAFPWIGIGAQPWRTGTIGATVSAQIDPQLFQEGIGALAGGDMSVSAGRNISDISLVSTSSLTTASVSGGAGPGQALVTLGGGDVNAIAGGNILGGRVDVASGQANLTAYGNLASAGQVPGAVQGQTFQDNTLRLRLTDATVSILAGGAVTLQGITSLGVSTFSATEFGNLQTIQDALNVQGFYSSASAVSILANGPVTIANAGEDVITANSGIYSGNVQAAVYPGSLTAISLTGNLDVVTASTPTINNVASQALLYPSPTGTLRLIAGGDIAPLTIAMEDVDPTLLPGAFSLFTLGTGGVTFDFPVILPNTTDATRRLLHNSNPTHTGDTTPNQIIAGGDITSLTFSSPKEADISAGRDLVNAVFLGQNLSPTDVTEISAGRDIIGTTTLAQPVIAYSSSTQVATFGPALPTVQGNTFEVGGPGAFFLEAGRDAGPFLNSAVTNGFANTAGYTPTGVLTWAGGIQAVGNLWNPWLPLQSASIVTEFGVSKGQNDAGLISAYLAPTSFAAAPDYLFEQTTDANGLTVVNRNEQIYSLDLPTWLRSIAPRIIAQYKATVAASGGTVPPSTLVQVAQALQNGQSVTLSQALSVLPQAAGDRMPLIPWLQLNYASLLQSQFGTLNVTYQQAFDAFQILPVLNQRLFLLKDVYFNELVQTSIPSSPSYLQYSRGYQAVNALFPASLGYTQNGLSGGANGASTLVSTGNLDLRLSTIQTDQGGDVILLGPGGEILAGSTVATVDQAARRDYAGGALYSAGSMTAPLTSTITAIPAGYEGILALQGGGIDSFTDGSLLLNQSRLFTEGGGDIALWSSNANLNAGQGPRTSADFPPVVVRIDEDAFSLVNAAAGVSGAGIAAFQPDPTAPAPDVFLIAPRGTVDAGAAGVRSAGSIFVAAFQVANATGFSASQSVSGIGGPAAVNVSAQTSASAASAAAAQAAQAASSGGNSAIDRTVITVDVLGYLAGLSDSSDEEEQKRKKK